MLSIRNVEVHLKNFKLGPLSFDVSKGEYFVILGPSGAGKSMLLEVIAGFRKSKGEIIVDGVNISEMPPERRRVGFLMQEPLLFPHMNVMENILFGALKDGFDRALYISKLLRIDSIFERDVNVLSGGEKQRVALARALSPNPLVLLLDEPFSWLDPGAKEEIMEEFKLLTKELSLTVIHVTHDFKEAFFLGDRIGIMNEGRVIQIGRPDEIINGPENEFVAKFIGIPNVYRGFVEGNCLFLNGEILKLCTKISDGEKCFYINPYKVQVFKSEVDGAIKAKVKSISYRHPLWKVKLEGSFELTIFLQSPVVGDERLNEGEEVFVRIPWDAIRFME